MINIFTRSTLLLLIVSTILACQHNKRVLTPAEKSDFKTLSSNAGLNAFLQECVTHNPSLSLRNFALNDSLSLPVVYFSSKDKPANNPIRIMIIAQQHGNEPSGLEGLLLLISQMANGKYDHWLQYAELMLIPQCNPYGGDKHRRRNAEGIDLNRDHLLLQARETQFIQQLFDEFDPHFTADLHEYYPYSASWEEFGYMRNFDIQLGGPTNLNTSDEIRYAFGQRLMPYVEKQLQSRGFSFFEYTLGHLPSGERMRRSTTDIDDGRQSFAITGTFSVIVEGMNGRDSLDRLERRAKSQMHTAEALIAWATQNRNEIMKMVQDSRQQIIDLQVPVAIRQEHVPDGMMLSYPLKSLKTGMDTVFVVENYHNKVVSNLDVVAPKGYLIPRNNKLLSDWLSRSTFFKTADVLPEGKIYAYQLLGFEESIDEELSNQKALVARVDMQNIDTNDYVFIPLNQQYNLRIIKALEPQSMYGLINYKGFEPLKDEAIWPVLRLE
ncbi:MAG TPA: DUF2817 domain-containing protein [Bacteroidales bacterium]|nr:DUF2817 domain-containing protein [Bacteroidales bacterium]